MKNFRKKLVKLAKNLGDQSRRVLGYPVTLGYDFSYLQPFLKFFINNIGDPFVEGSYRVEVKQLERDILNFFRKVFHLPRNDYWGYVTTGSTEGNMFGMFQARQHYPKGIIYCSQDTHYSVFKNAAILNMPVVLVNSRENGEIDYHDLGLKLKKSKSRPAIIIANIGTTMKGAIDDIPQIIKITKRARMKNFYIHVDAALSGMILPFLPESPVFDFRLPIHSLTFSSYKVIGVPLSSGVVLTRKNLVKIKNAKHFIPYIKTIDDTVSGSRSGFHSLLLWSAIKELGLKGFRQRANASIKNSEWLLKQFQKIGWPAWKNPHAPIVVIKKPPQKILSKWLLASHGELSHIIVLPHVEINTLKQFLSELKKYIS
ncbi:MAG: histidine decarboxylase [Candidatus Niyogibacteria bacterium]|nr:histidine decarboxylase [Candidatus Niyogibacteria bacterium]